jgi:hypothetical protein
MTRVAYRAKDGRYTFAAQVPTSAVAQKLFFELTGTARTQSQAGSTSSSIKIDSIISN